MKERYLAKNLSEKKDGPSDLIIKRILAFSKSLNSKGIVTFDQENDQIEK